MFVATGRRWGGRGGGKTTNMLMMNAGMEITLSQALFAALSRERRGRNGFRCRIANLESCPARSMMENLFVAARGKGNILFFLFLLSVEPDCGAKQSSPANGKVP